MGTSHTALDARRRHSLSVGNGPGCCGHTMATQAWKSPAGKGQGWAYIVSGVSLPKESRWAWHTFPCLPEKLALLSTRFSWSPLCPHPQQHLGSCSFTSPRHRPQGGTQLLSFLSIRNHSWKAMSEYSLYWRSEERGCYLTAMRTVRVDLPQPLPLGLPCPTPPYPLSAVPPPISCHF